MLWGQAAHVRAMPARPPVRSRSSVRPIPEGSLGQLEVVRTEQVGVQRASRIGRSTLKDALGGIGLLPEIHQLVGVGCRLPEDLAEQPQHLGNRNTAYR